MRRKSIMGRIIKRFEGKNDNSFMVKLAYKASPDFEEDYYFAVFHKEDAQYAKEHYQTGDFIHVEGFGGITRNNSNTRFEVTVKRHNVGIKDRYWASEMLSGYVTSIDEIEGSLLVTVNSYDGTFKGEHKHSFVSCICKYHNRKIAQEKIRQGDLVSFQGDTHLKLSRNLVYERIVTDRIESHLAPERNV